MSPMKIIDAAESDRPYVIDLIERRVLVPNSKPHNSLTNTAILDIFVPFPTVYFLVTDAQFFLTNV